MHEATTTIERPTDEATSDLDRYVQEVVDEAPPLTATQIVALKRVFRP